MISRRPPDHIRDWLSYDPATGLFHWLRAPSPVVTPGDVAGAVGTRGYICIQFEGGRYRANRLAWFFVTGEWPETIVDHRNGVTSDDRFENLRLASKAQNRANSKGRPGLKGVTVERGRYRARISVNGATLALGYFGTAEEAHAAYRAAAVRHFGEFARFE